MNEVGPLNLVHAAQPPLDVAELVLNIVISGGLSWMVGIHYRRFGLTLGSRDALARVLPFVAAVTTLLIAVVKSSLALSLGLVGALSIVRFRTPIKEPEELAYLFFAITIGLGLGADYRVATTAGAVVIALMVGLVQLRGRRLAARNLYLSFSLDVGAESAAAVVQPAHQVLQRHCQRIDLRRFDSEPGRVELAWFVDVRGVADVHAVCGELETRFPGVRLTLVDQGRLPAI
ncbi:MAG: DUF4956 domain-containing protein [Myxococcales bacterium]|nr:DUF4956 domain-containing protein [Myxococcales bacterium]